MITFDDARAVAATSRSVRDYWGEYTVLDWGWQNDEWYVLVYDLNDPAMVPFDIPALLVSKRSGTLREVSGLWVLIRFPVWCRLGLTPTPDSLSENLFSTK